MLEAIYDRVWAFGVRLRNHAKRASMLGRLEPTILKLMPLVVPAPKTASSVRLPSGMTMKLPPGYPASRSYSSGWYEPEVTNIFQTIVMKGMTIVDAGANVGYYTLLAAGLTGHIGRVHAFEPDPTNFTYLTENVNANGCLGVLAVCKALTSSEGEGKFVRDPRGAEGFLAQGPDSPEALEVQTTTLDSYFGELGWPRVHVVKIDIEGSEIRALEGMRELSRRNPQLQLIMELNRHALSRSGHTVHALAELLRELGFVGGRIIETGQSFSLNTDELPNTGATYNLLLIKETVPSRP